eukprot:6203002-Pleurochrysis_carterae.AAC.1
MAEFCFLVWQRKNGLEDGWAEGSTLRPVTSKLGRPFRLFAQSKDWARGQLQGHGENNGES